MVVVEVCRIRGRGVAVVVGMDVVTIIDTSVVTGHGEVTTVEEAPGDHHPIHLVGVIGDRRKVTAIGYFG